MSTRKRNSNTLTITDQITSALEERDGLQRDLEQAEDKLRKLQFDPERLIGACFRGTCGYRNSTEYYRIKSFERGAFEYVKIELSEGNMRADRSDSGHSMTIGRETPGHFLDSDWEEIDAQEFNNAMSNFMGMVTA